MRIAAAFAVLALLSVSGRAAAETPRERMERAMRDTASGAGVIVPDGALSPAAAPATPAALAAMKPYVVIFEGPTICDGCQTPFEKFFRRKGYDVRAVKPGGSTPERLMGAAAYIVPGGEDVTRLEDAWTAADRAAIRDYVRRGGRYYGACLGGYWAGKEGTWPGVIPGFEALDMIPATVLELSANDKSDKVVPIHWNGLPRRAYFQDGPTFAITDRARVIKIYATYDSDATPGHVAAFSARYGRGTVIVDGVHVEAERDWYDDEHLPAPKNMNRDLLEEILGDLLQGAAVL